jgi:hypothetical protein
MEGLLMGNEVYANGMELACKAGQGKSICAFPDVCFTPPQTPATPPGVPIPYPNTGMASDTSDGSKTVQISGQEVMLKDKSNFKKGTGNEAGCAPKKGVVTSTNHPPGAPSGSKAYFNAWSMDVKFESENVVRHFDITTHNHASQTGQTPPWPYTDRMAMAEGLKSCEKETAAADKACEKGTGGGFKCPDLSGLSADQKSVKMEKHSDCQRALRCMLSPKDPSKCCPGQTPHHLVPAASFTGSSVLSGKPGWGAGEPNYNAAPCICAEGFNGTAGTHGLIHAAQKKAVMDKFPGIGVTAIGDTQTQTFSDAVQQGGAAANEVFPQCSEKCINSQLRREHRKMGITAKTKVKPVAHGPKDVSKFKQLFNQIQQKLTNSIAGAP